MPRLTHRQIEAFRAVMELGSATAAADALCITQSGVSRLIADLEYNVDFALFTRQGRGLEPTAEAILLNKEVERSLRGLERISEYAVTIKNSDVGIIRVIAPPTYTDGFVSQVVGRFLTAHTKILIDIDTASREQVLDGITTKMYDIGVVTLPITRPSVEILAVRNHEAVCIYPAAMGLEKFGRLSPKDLLNYPFLMHSQITPLRLATERFFGSTGLEPRIIGAARSQRVLCGIVAAGAGLAIVDRTVVEAYPIEGIKIAELDQSLTWEVGIIAPQKQAQPRTLQELVREFAAIS